VVTPGSGRWALATVYIVIVATILVLRGRAFTTRTQAVLIVVTGLAMYAAAAVRVHAGVGQRRGELLGGRADSGAGRTGADHRRHRAPTSFSPVFRKVVEWLEYLLVVLVPVLAVWLLNVFTSSGTADGPPGSQRLAAATAVAGDSGAARPQRHRRSDHPTGDRPQRSPGRRAARTGRG
jgi:hypothetical protein